MPKLTKAALEQTIDHISEVIDEALDPELTREELVSKVKEISDLVNDDGLGNEEVADKEEF